MTTATRPTTRPAIAFDRVWKGYPAWASAGGGGRAAVRRRMLGVVGRGPVHWAVRDLSLSVGPGDCVGLIGVNGAGKSTLLRLGAGLSRPTRGAVSVPGDTASVLALGEAFDVALTGRENAYTTALLAGVRRSAARALVADVLAFAELGEFADEPVRTYSEGMKLRLAFGVVAQLRPAALLFDEVIAVGDAGFQAKCLAFVRELRDGGTAVLLATHATELVDEHCTAAVWLQAGMPRAAGAPTEVTAAYRAAMHSESASRTPEAPGADDGELVLRKNRFGSQELTIDGVAFSSPSGASATALPAGAGLTIHLRLVPGAAVDPPAVVVSIRRSDDGVICWEANTHADGVRLPPITGPTAVELALPALDLQPGEYHVDVGAYRPDWSYAYDYHWSAYDLTVAGVPGAGVLRTRHDWTIDA